jgi:hypothetical protein
MTCDLQRQTSWQNLLNNPVCRPKYCIFCKTLQRLSLKGSRRTIFFSFALDREHLCVWLCFLFHTIYAQLFQLGFMFEGSKHWSGGREGGDTWPEPTLICKKSLKYEIDCDIWEFDKHLWNWPSESPVDPSFPRSWIRHVRPCHGRLHFYLNRHSGYKAIQSWQLI